VIEYKKSLCCEIIKTCPLSCIHCSANSNMKAKEYISLEDIYSIVENAMDNNVETFFISGGEPLLHPNILEIVKFIKSKNIKPIIYSSGCLADEDSGDIEEINISFLNNLKKNGLDSIVFSLFSLVDDVHNNKTQTKNSFSILKRTLTNTKKTFENTEVKVELSFIPLSDTYKEIKEIIKFSENNNISKINILKLINQGRAKYSGLENLSVDQENELLENLKNSENKNIQIEISKLYDCDNYEGLLQSPYTAGENEYFITSRQEVLPGRRFRK